MLSISWNSYIADSLKIWVLLSALTLNKPRIKSSVNFNGSLRFYCSELVNFYYMYIQFVSFFLYFYQFTSSIFLIIKNYLIIDVNVLWIACMKSSTKLKIYNIDSNVDVFYMMAFVIIYIESPIIKHINVVTLFAMELKKLTLGNKHTPSSA